MEKYQLMTSWNRPNVQGRKWVAQDEDAKTALIQEENLVFGDEVYVIESQKNYIIGEDGQPYEKPTGGGGGGGGGGSSKADKVKSAVDGDLAGLNAFGNLTDSGIAASNVVQKLSTYTAGDLLVANEDGGLADADLSAEDIESALESVEIIDKTYAELATLKSNGGLIPGAKYRITDYQTIINGTVNAMFGYIHYAQSLETVFNIIVTARTIGSFYEDAIANYNSDEFKIKYCFENNTIRFAWANENGKGVIYYMQDTYGNEAGYDFLSIRFLAYGLAAADGQNDSPFCYENSGLRFGSVYHFVQVLLDYMQTGEYHSPFPADANLDFSAGTNILSAFSYPEVTDEYLSTFNAGWYSTFCDSRGWGLSPINTYNDIVSNNKISITDDYFTKVMFDDNKTWYKFGLPCNIFIGAEQDGSTRTLFPINNLNVEYGCYGNIFYWPLQANLQTNCSGNIGYSSAVDFSNYTNMCVVSENCIVETVDPLINNLYITAPTADRPSTIYIGKTSGGTIRKWYISDETGGGGASLLETTYAALVSAKTGGTLVPGAFYRIIDYVTKINGTYDLSTMTGQDTYIHYAKSAEHPFDLIVQALDETTLDEHARAIQHSGDTYFANSDLLAWDVKYTTENDPAKYAWADATNGKGVIYYMKDEFDNECSYDFKNVQFLAYAITTADPNEDDYLEDLNYTTSGYRCGAVYYVFEALQSYMSTGDYSIPFPSEWNKDFSVGANILGTVQFSTVDATYLSTFDADWYYTFDSEISGEHADYSLNASGQVFCHSNHISACEDALAGTMSLQIIPFGLNGIIFEKTYGECMQNNIGANNWLHIFNGGHSNTLGSVCIANIIFDSYATIGNAVSHNAVSSGRCILGSNTTECVIGKGSSNITMGMYCHNIVVSEDCISCTLENGASHITLFNPDGTSLEKEWYTVLSGDYNGHTVTMQSRSYPTYIGINSSGVVKEWTPADLVQ